MQATREAALKELGEKVLKELTKGEEELMSPLVVLLDQNKYASKGLPHSALNSNIESAIEPLTTEVEKSLGV